MRATIDRNVKETRERKDESAMGKSADRSERDDRRDILLEWNTPNTTCYALYICGDKYKNEVHSLLLLGILLFKCRL